jgi:hypothetical protein
MEAKALLVNQVIEATVIETLPELVAHTLKQQ